VRTEAIHRALLEKWRGAMDLVGPGPLDLHFDDSRAAVEGLAARGRWADLGSGAGFPGVALATAFPDAHVLLVESREKRAQFLEALVAELAVPNLAVHHGRAEDLAPGFDGVISRAMAAPAVVLTHAARLAPRAVLLLTDRQSVDLSGWRIEEDRTYELAGKRRRRLVLARG
jgi:16S rRNA (guanine(527)-N(7))-methyltransferase RsmG